MPQISKYKLEKDFEEELYKQFGRSLGKINDGRKSAEFFGDLLTVTEKLMLAKRFACAVLLMRNKSSVEIKKSIHVSFSTIGTISAWVKNARPHTKKVLLDISQEKEMESFFDKVESILHKLPPPLYSNWKDENKNRNTKLRRRLAKEKLR